MVLPLLFAAVSAYFPTGDIMKFEHISSHLWRGAISGYATFAPTPNNNVYARRRGEKLTNSRGKTANGRNVRWKRVF